ncbi:DNA gyrase inhibitor YacG [Neptunicella marina]|uniref:DNA gyrase inhibitor YacG n=1 Tax=Neptunicella marina TaxID=2125989 RepID=A0A8J6INU8_9ALTE|nr:DNA gyrase inhibitor YacG [Neptunicella marina]MBC3765310.1 DNA gyrase inhibitor YacG [Neptunicella marina]
MQVNCPQCDAEVEWGEQSPYRPFCSKRCQLIDLGEWANEEKTIPCGKNQDAETAVNAIDIEDIEAMLADEQQSFFNN